MKRMGKQPRRYKFFFLNPYTDVRFSYCPKCEGKTKLRKVPLLIGQIQTLHQPLVLNKSCRYCPACDLLIAHQDEIEQQLAGIPDQHHPPAEPDKNYEIMGTLDRSDWQKNTTEPVKPAQLFDSLYAFKQVLKFEPSRWIKLKVEWKHID